MNVTHEIVSRCLALIPLVREHQGIGLDELASLARIPKEQIADELGAVLMMCGVPPYFPHDYIDFSLDEDRVRIRFADHFRRPVSLNPLEALALKLACESVAPPGKAIPKSVASLLRKVETAMGEDQRRQFVNLARRVIVRQPVEAPGGITGRIAMAVAERRRLTMEYLSAGKNHPGERVVDPYGLIGREGHWYLIARDGVRARVLTFRLDRIRRIQAMTERFEIEAGFKLDDYVHGALIPEGDDTPRASVRCTGVAARWLREIAAPGTLHEEEGAVLWEPPMASEEALARWILSLGSEAMVLGPDSLRSAVRKGLSEVLALHA